jgi:hypothetical protein
LRLVRRPRPQSQVGELRGALRTAQRTVEHLRQLVIDAEPYVPDNEQTRTMDLPARLKAEVDRH